MSGHRKKFTIRQFKPPQQVDKNQAERVWNSLKAAIHQIHSQDASSLSFEQLYRYAYNLVLHHHGDMLYDGVRAEVRTHLLDVAKVVGENPDETLLQSLGQQWGLHKVTMVMIRDILMYMDRIYVVKTRKDKVYDFGLILFRDVVVRQPRVRPRLRRLLLDNVRRERSGEFIDKSLMKNTLGMLVELGVSQVSQDSAARTKSSTQHKSNSRSPMEAQGSGHAVYEVEFEEPFLEETQAFYHEEAQRFIAENTCPVYLRKAEERIIQERNRVRDYLSPSTADSLRNIVETNLISLHAETLVEMANSGLVPMLRDNKVEDLQRMYDLFSGPKKLDIVSKGMANYVVREGEALVSDTERARVPVEFARNLLEMRDKYDNIVREAFRADKAFQRALKNSFEKFMNMDTRCAQFLALYVDDLLRHGINGMRDEDIDATLDKVIVIFRYLTDKDVFEAFYKTHLQKRLLHGKSSSDDWERTMIAKLKTECGFQFTSKLEGMFSDMRLSKELNESFRKSQFAHGPAPGATGASAAAGAARGGGSGSDTGTSDLVDINVTVLTTGFWPAQNVTPCRLPVRISNCAERFKAFYLHQHSAKHELNVTTYQMCILMLFNKSDCMTLREIMELTDIPEADCKRHLVSLCTPRSRILLKSRKGKDVQPNDEFQFNAKFTSKLRRVKVPLISNKSTRTAGKSTAGDTGGTKSGGQRSEGSSRNAGGIGGVSDAVEESRRHLVEAAIVRIMKTRKTLDNNNLVAEVTKQLSSRFRPTPQLIKKRIESLIEREYLERTEGDRRVFQYIA